MSDSSVHGRRRRVKGQDVSVRAEALQRLKTLRDSGSRRAASGVGFQIKLEEPIYDTVEEDDYAALVSRRQENAGGFIVDDDGLGYADDGHEEDWSNPSFTHSSKDEFSEGEEEKHRKKKASKKDSADKKPLPGSLSTSTSLMGKHLISSMFTSLVFKKSDRVKGSPLSSDSLIDDVLAEFAPDETDREKRRMVGARIYALPPVVPIKTEMQPLNVEIELPQVASSVVVKEGILENGSEVHEKEVTVEKEDMCLHSGMEVVDMEKLNTCKASIIEGVDAEAIINTKGFSLNTTIKKEEENTTASATAGRKAVCSEDVTWGCLQVESNGNLDEKSKFELDSDGSLPFYIIDAHEESFGANMGNLYLFGKVKVGGAFHSCCIVVKNMQRCVYVIPGSSVFPYDKVAEAEQNFADSPLALRGALQEMSSELKNEIIERLLDLNVSTFSMFPVKRGYAFERTDIPRGEYYVLKVRYPFKEPPLSTNLKGQNFIALLGTHSSALELFLIKRKINGPTWLSISRFISSTTSERVSWCKFEVVVDCSKDIYVTSSKNFLEIPPLVVAAVNLKTIITEKNANEIVSASVTCCHKTKVDEPIMLSSGMLSEWKRKGMLSHFTVVQKLDNAIFPLGLQKEFANRNSKDGINVLALESSERALINRLMIELHILDCDVLVGHNISGFDLDVLLHRTQACKVPSSMWSKIGRLKRSIMPKLTKGSALYGSGASPGIMSCIAGRLLCDTYLISRDLLKEVSYSLTQLAKTQLEKDRKEVSPHDIPGMFQTSATLLQLVEYGKSDALLSLELMFHLNVLPLTRQLTNISGNLWGKSLQGARAQQVEYLLLHTFHAKKYMVPDKFSARRIEPTATKRKMTAGLDSKGADDLNNIAHDNEVQSIGNYKGKKIPTYSGGLVLEPKKGLYDKYIILLDFNSLYPSIIREYNICFTTVERPIDDMVPNLPSSKNAGILPELLGKLVIKRAAVKNSLKKASRRGAQQLNIEQQALKLTANSMYGCLGFSNSRFYAKPIAELITSQGREILQSTVDLVQNNLNFEVIYGDTDSIMIFSGQNDIDEAKKIATKVIEEVNKKYRHLKIDLDGLYKRMLLLKKKKYAAVKEQSKDGTADKFQIIECKGLDIIRRDWSLLSKEIGDFCLRQILSEGTCEDVVESIHGYLMKVQEDMRKKKIALEKYVIVKSLTKPPEDYRDAKNQPHVQVALRLKKNGYPYCSSGDTIPYVICCLQDGSGSTGGILAQRARHPDELTRENAKWIIDIDYYLSQQIHPVVSRLCACIQGTSPARLADCLGLDSAKFQYKSSDTGNKDSSNITLSVINDGERFNCCEQLRLSCPSCSSVFDCPPISAFFLTSDKSTLNSSENKSDVNFWGKMRCPRCPDDVDGCKVTPAMIANQVKRQAEHFISLYYKGLMTCDDEMCKYMTRSLNLRVIGDSERGTVCPNYPRCNGRLVQNFDVADLYKQLSYFCYVLDATRSIEKLDTKSIPAFEKKIAIIRSAVDLAVLVIQKIRDRCAYGWVRLRDISV